VKSPLAVAAICAFALAACGGAQHGSGDDDDDDATPAAGSPFHGLRKFVPTSFSDKVTGSGRPIIFIPGLGCPGDVWDETVEHLGSGYEAHVLTLSGFAGRPSLPAGKPLVKTVKKELIRYIHAQRLKNPIIVGHSLGGVLAYWIAASAPSLVGPVIVVDAGPALSDTDEDTAENLRKIWTQTDGAQFAQQVQAVFGAMASNTKRMQPVIDEVAKSDPHAMGDAIYEMTQLDLREKVSHITAPVLVVLADGIFQKQIAQQVAVIQTRKVVLIQNTRHFVMFDDPPAFFHVVDGFLADHP
jgi:pimeloyl-ACP methyl ester carboxylesterase